MSTFKKDKQYIKFCAYGFLKNLRFYDVFLLLFFLENGIPYSQIGILYASRELALIIAEIPSGMVADTYGRKNSLVAAFIAYIISFPVFYVSTDFYLFLIAMILIGIGDAFRSGTHKGMIMHYLELNNWEDHKIDYYGHTRSWSHRGSALSSLFAGVLVLYTGSYRVIYLYAAIPYLINFINILTYPKVLNDASKGSKSKKRSLVEAYRNFVTAIRQPKVFQIINSAAVHSAFLKSIKDYIQPIMVQIAILIPVLVTFDIKRKSALIIGILYFGIFLLNSAASRFSFRIYSIGFKNILKLSMLAGLAAGMICGIAIWKELWVVALILFIMIYLVENVRKPILTAALADHVPVKIFTSVMSAQSFYGTILTSILAITFGVLADHFGIGPALLSISGILVLLTIVVDRLKVKSD